MPKVKTTKAFDEAYDMLNPEQRAAVDTIEGPVMVVAGPGTGKTQILTLRIANILKQTDIDPENILALTFTEAAVQNMRKRLVKMIGNRGHEVRIATFHGFANEIIQDNPEYFPDIVGAEPVTDVEQVALIEKIILNTKELDLLRPFGDNFYYVRPILSVLDELKREGITPDRFAKIVKKEEQRLDDIDDLYYESGAHKGKMRGKYQTLFKQLKKNQELVHIYRSYQKSLRAEQSYDYTDMIVEVMEAFSRNDELLLIMQERYQYILVDEHQDTNNAQNRILEKLAGFHDNPNIFVVGDEKQSIFRFQGASLENFFYFKYLYPGAQLITLRQNYRSTQAILNSADSLLAGVESLQANVSYEEKPIQVYSFSKPEVELYFLSQSIAGLIENGEEASDIAVLYRDNRDAFAIANALEKKGVPFIIESEQDILSDDIIAQVITVCEVIHYFGSDDVLAKYLHLPAVNLDPLDVVKMIRSGSQRRKYSLYDLFERKPLRKDIVLSDDDALVAAYKNIKTWRKQAQKVDVFTLMEEIIREGGFLQMVLGHENSAEKLDALNRFFDEVRTFAGRQTSAKLSDFMQYLETIRRHGMRLSSKKRTSRTGYVRLMTVHRSKGLEFEHVYLAGVYNGHFGNKRRANVLPLLQGVYQLVEDEEKSAVVNYDPDANDDERRLFYVALTRARQMITVTYPAFDADNKELLPSPFIEEIDESLIEFNDSADVEAKFAGDGAFFFQVSQPMSEAVIDPDYIREIFLKQSLSVSALNNYLKSPWLYFYRNLVRIPSLPSKHQAYGIAVHAVMQDMFESLRHEESVGKRFLIDRFTHHMEEQSMLSSDDYEESLSKGKESLSAWFDHHSQSGWIQETVSEMRINGVEFGLECVPGEAVRLTGVLDKVEFINDSEVNVVDYKTGKPKSRNVITGNTKTSNGDYYRQLVFYKLLLNRWQDGRYNMVSGEIDFIEPDSKGKLHKERFEIHEADVEELEETIQRVASEIMNLEFLSAECDDKVCEYCDLVTMLKGWEPTG